jgi:Zn-finger nucleic acid-binding protein
MSPEVVERFPCPNCKAVSAILTLERYGVRTFYCPDCQQVWNEHVQKKPPTP